MSDGPEHKKEPHGPVASDVLDRVFSGPAFAANRAFSTLTAGGLRLTFMEQASKETTLHFRAAVMLDFTQAIELRNLLNRQLKDVESELAKVQSEVNSDQEQTPPDAK